VGDQKDALDTKNPGVQLETRDTEVIRNHEFVESAP